MYSLTALSHADAAAIIDAARKELERRGKGATVAVADEHGELLAFLRLDGAPLSCINNAINKAYTSARERKTSMALGQASREENFPLTNYGDLRYCGWGGGVPVVVDGRTVGGVGVSGLSQEEDEEIALIGAAAVTG